MKRKRITSLFDITIGQYQKYLELKEPTNRQIISVFYNIPYELTADIPIKQINSEALQLKELFESKPEFIKKYKGLGFEPDLDNMKAGAFADAFEYSKNESTWHLFTAVMYRPIVKDWFWLTKSKKYNIKKYKSAKEIEDKAKQLPLALLMSAQGFFFDLRQSFLSVIHQRAHEKSKHLNQSPKQKGSTGIGDGVSNFMQLLEETILKLKELQMNLLAK